MPVDSQGPNGCLGDFEETFVACSAVCITSIRSMAAQQVVLESIGIATCLGKLRILSRVNSEAWFRAFPNAHLRPPPTNLARQAMSHAGKSISSSRRPMPSAWQSTRGRWPQKSASCSADSSSPCRQERDCLFPVEPCLDEWPIQILLGEVGIVAQPPAWACHPNRH